MDKGKMAVVGEVREMEINPEVKGDVVEVYETFRKALDKIVELRGKNQEESHKISCVLTLSHDDSKSRTEFVHCSTLDLARHINSLSKDYPQVEKAMAFLKMMGGVMGDDKESEGKEDTPDGMPKGLASLMKAMREPDDSDSKKDKA